MGKAKGKGKDASAKARDKAGAGGNRADDEPVAETTADGKKRRVAAPRIGDTCTCDICGATTNKDKHQTTDSNDNI